MKLKPQASWEGVEKIFSAKEGLQRCLYAVLLMGKGRPVLFYYHLVFIKFKGVGGIQLAAVTSCFFHDLTSSSERDLELKVIQSGALQRAPGVNLEISSIQLRVETPQSQKKAHLNNTIKQIDSCFTPEFKKTKQKTVTHIKN